LGSVGKCPPANVVVDPAFEKNLGQDGMAKNQEKRWYFLGTDIPSDRVVTSPFINRRGGPRSPTSPLQHHSRQSSQGMDM
jgi:hypothetical protein